MRVLIIEDEIHAAERLETLIKSSNPNAEITQVCQSVKKTIAWLQSNDDIDIIFSDIQLGDGTSFDIFQTVEVSCPIVFVTAYDSYAIKAFDVFSIDYILKPYDVNQIKAAFKKHETYTAKRQKTEELFRNIKHAYTRTYKTRFISQIGEKVFTISVEEVSCFIFEDGLVILLAKEGKKYALQQSLDAIETLVDPNKFFRINRQMIINHTSIEDIRIDSKGILRLSIQAYTSKSSISVSRRRTSSFKIWLDQ